MISTKTHSTELTTNTQASTASVSTVSTAKASTEYSTSVSTLKTAQTTPAPSTTKTNMTPSPTMITNVTAERPSAAPWTAQITMTQSKTANLSSSSTTTVSTTKQTTMKSSPTTITNMPAETTKTTASAVQPTTIPSITTKTPSITTTIYFTNGTAITAASTPQTLSPLTPETTTTTSQTNTIPPKTTTPSTPETTATDLQKITTPSQTSTSSTTETTTTPTLTPTTYFADSTTLTDATTPKISTQSTPELITTTSQTTTTPLQTSTTSTTETTTTPTLLPTTTFAESTTLTDATTPKTTTLSTTETTTTPSITTTITTPTPPTTSYTTEIISTSKTTFKITTTSSQPTYSSEITSTSTFETSEMPNTIVSEATTIAMVETSDTSTSSASSSSYTTITAIDCGPVETIPNGQIDLNDPLNTTYGATANVTCDSGFDVSIYEVACLGNGLWSEPSCKPKEMPYLTCKNDTDTRGTLWTEILANTTRSYDCDNGSKGYKSRKCRPDGTWELPQYSCVREEVENVNNQLNDLTTNVNITTEEITVALEALTNVTTTHGTNAATALTDGEITAITSSLENVATLLNNSTKFDPVNISKHFMESASNLLDSSNQESWKAMKESVRTRFLSVNCIKNNNGAETMLKAVDSVGSAIKRSIQTGNRTSVTIVKTNVALEVKKTGEESIEFPAKSSSDNPADADKDWIHKSHSNLTLDKRAFKEDKTYITTAIMYRDMSDILPTQSNENTTGNGNQKEINGPVLSLSLDPAIGKLTPPIRITFGHFLTNLSEPACNYWQFGKDNQAGGWSTDGCFVNYSSAIQTVCECTHLTNFAVLMSPFVQADADSIPLRIVSIVGIAVSMFCLLLTSSLYICLWKYLKNDRAVILLNLCIALFFSYIVFLAGVDRTESKEFCSVVAALLHYIYLVVFCLMLAEGIDIAYTVLYVFATRSRARSLVIASWVIPAVIVGISLGATQTQGYGNTNFCWLSLSRGVIWAFVAPALLIISLNIICLVLVFRKMLRMKAMESKKTTEKIQTSLRSLCVLVPLMGVSWILGIFYINEDLYFMQYLFAICNGLQGLFIFLFHCALNKKIQNGCQMRRRRMSAMKSTLKATYRSSSKERSKSKDLKSFSSESRDIDASIDWSNWVLNGTPETDEGQKLRSPVGGGAFGHNHRPTVAFNPPAEYSPHTHDSRQSIKHRDSDKIEFDRGEDNNYDYIK
ncbi:adhesion G protein-coupled receptor L4-like [Mya arenaria]|uniref:adhesion G protein-coupled receptor L4-like n=1 Tax=Mya arenaria TaxID=6604 RepID=UPI0022E8FF39|nr:adhesion G protein-coupled receptor L4-like [Mya arenaria]